MSTFRRLKPEAALHLYSLPRRELQALCKQHGIPANKTNVAMADALCAFVPFESAKAKAAAGPNPLGIAKTTTMKAKVEKKTEIPEISLASIILSGKVMPSPAKQKPAVVAREKEVSLAQVNTTPLRRGVKRSERPLASLPEEKPHLSTETRGVALQDRFGKAAAVGSPRARAFTPRKRAAEASTIVTTRGRGAPPPVPFSDLLSTPKKAELPPPPNFIKLDSTGKSAKSRLGLALKDAGKRVVTFASELVDVRACRVPALDAEPEMEAVEVSYAEIEFKDRALHKELLGVCKAVAKAEEADAIPEVLQAEVREEVEGVSESMQARFEYRNMALHKELFGPAPQRNCEEEAVEMSQDEERQIAASGGSEEVHQDGQQLGLSELEGEDGASARSPSSALVREELPLVLPCAREDSHMDPGREEDEVDEGAGGDSSPTILVKECSKEIHMESAQRPDEAPKPDQELAKEETLEDSLSMIANRLQVDSAGAELAEPEHGDANNIHSSLAVDLPVVPSTCEAARLESRQEGEEVEEATECGPSHLHHVGDMAGDILVQKRSEEVHMRSASRLNEAHELDDEEEQAKRITGSVHSVSLIASGAVDPVGAEAAEMEEDGVANPLITPLTRIQSNIDATLAKANSILEKLASWRADAEKKVAEGHWEPKASPLEPQGDAVEEDVSAVVEVSPDIVEVKKLIAKKVPEVERDLPSAKKARVSTKAVPGPETTLVVCEDVDVAPKGELPPSAKKPRISTEATDASQVSDKENQSDKSMEDMNSRKARVHGKDKKKAKKYEVLKDRSMNVLLHTSTGTAHGVIVIPDRTGLQEMSLRALRAHVKEKDRQLDPAKASLALRPQRGRNMAH